MINGMKKNKNDTWRTPGWLFEQLDARYRFSLDAAASKQNTLVQHDYYTEEENGLIHPWTGKRVFCNPPFSKKDDWMLKADKEVQDHGCPIVVMLLPMQCMTTKMFNTVIQGRYRYEFPPHRVNYEDDNGKEITGNTGGTLIVYFEKRICKP